MYEPLYPRVWYCNIQDIIYVRKGTYCIQEEQENCSTKKHMEDVKKNDESGKLTKRSLNQINERPT
jgi:hypothetical protein